MRIRERAFLRELGVDLFDAFLDQLVDLGLGGEVGIARIGNPAAFGPVADGAHVDVDEGADLVAAVAESHRFLDVREELELVLDIVGRVHRAGRELAHVLGAVDDLELSALVEEAGVAGMKVTLGVDGFRGRVGTLVILLEQHRSANQNLAVVGNLDLDPGRGLSDGIELHAAVRLQADVGAGLGRAVQLLQVDADRTVEAEQVRPDRRTRGIRNADAAHAEHVAQRAVHQKIADGITQPVGE